MVIYNKQNALLSEVVHLFCMFAIDLRLLLIQYLQFIPKHIPNNLFSKKNNLWYVCFSRASIATETD